MGTRLCQKQRKHKECGFVVTLVRGAVYKLLSEEQEADPELTGIGALAKADQTHLHQISWCQNMKG